MTPCLMEEIAEERTPPSASSSLSSEASSRLHIGKRAVAAELPEVDHEMRAFISRYADTYDDEYDDSFAVHADLAMEPLAEDEAEQQAPGEKPALPHVAAANADSSADQPDGAEPSSLSFAGRGRGRGSKSSGKSGGGGGSSSSGNAGKKIHASRKRGNMKKTGLTGLMRDQNK